MPEARTDLSPFVGRAEELRLLRRALDDAVAGHGRLALLVGEPGIGKTRTADELAAAAAGRGATVVWGRCWESAGAPAFWPWEQILRALLRARDPRELVAQLGTAAPDVAQLVPAIRPHLGNWSPVAPSDSEQARFRLFDSVTSLLLETSRAAPLVLILDDLHWADRPSLLLLQFLAREMQAAHLLVVATARDLDERAHPSLDEALGALRREPVHLRVPLAGLAEGDVAMLLNAMGGHAVPERMARAVFERTEGNPFYVAELARDLLTRGVLAADDQDGGAVLREVGVPEGVREVIGRRLARLSEAARQALGLAAVVGREFDVAVLEQLGAHSLSAPLLDALDEAAAAGLLAEVPHAVGRYSFAHALIRETLYEEWGGARRARLHREIGELLERMHARHLEPHLAEVATHFYEAGRGEALGREVDDCRRAAEYAMRRLAYEEGARLYAMAIEALSRQEPEDRSLLAELSMALGEAHRRSGDQRAAREAFERAATLARILGDARMLAAAALGYGGLYVEVGAVDERLQHLLEEALAALPEEPSPLRARVLARLAIELSYAAGLERASGLSRAAVAMARDAGDPATLAFALSASHLTGLASEAPGRQIAIATEMVQAAEQAGDLELAAEGRGWRVHTLLEIGDLTSLDAEIEAHARLARELREPVYLWLSSMFRAMRALLVGAFADCERLAQQAFELGQRAQNPNAMQAFAAQMFFLRREQGRLGELRETLEAMARQYPSMPTWRAGLVDLYCEERLFHEARREYERVVFGSLGDLPRDSTAILRVALLARACAALGDSARAPRLYEMLLRCADRNVVVTGGTASLGAVSGYLGLLARTMERWDEAARHFDEALALDGRLGAIPALARTQCDYAELLLARGRGEDRARAELLLEQALTTAARLGMSALVERVRRLAPDLAPPRLAAEMAAAAPPPAAVEPAADAKPVFRRDGEYWTIEFEGRACRLRDIKGLNYLAELLRHPGQEFHASELVAALGRDPDALASAPVPDLEQMAVCDLGGLGAALDAQASAEYRSRLLELRDELRESEGFNDIGRADQLREEIRQLTQQLTAAARGQRSGSHGERARLTVTKAIKVALEKIKAGNPTLARHLGATVRRGYFCSYTPDPRFPISWET